MTAVGSILARVLALAIMTAVGVVLCDGSALAQKSGAKQDSDENGNGKKNGKKNGDGGDEDDGKDDGKKDGEDEKEEEGWIYKAKVNRAMLFWQDNGGRGGPFGRRRGASFVDNEQDNSGAEVEGTFRLGSGWVGVVKMGIEGKIASSKFISDS